MLPCLQMSIALNDLHTFIWIVERHRETHIVQNMRHAAGE